MLASLYPENLKLVGDEFWWAWSYDLSTQQLHILQLASVGSLSYLSDALHGQANPIHAAADLFFVQGSLDERLAISAPRTDEQRSECPLKDVILAGGTVYANWTQFFNV